MIPSPPFRRLISSNDGLRIARHARTVQSFPLFSDDPVHQWMIEEALTERLRRVETAEAEKAALAEAVAAAEKRVADERARVRQREMMH